jgi:excisionase family DNA binding protein
MTQKPLTVSVAEAAHLLGTSRELIYRAIVRGEIPAVRVGARRLVPRWVLEALLRGESPRKHDHAA